MTVLHMDYETRSRVNLLAEGAYKYAADPSTQVLCLGWAFDNDEPELWHPGMPFPKELKTFFGHGERRSIHAHNAAFERLISWYVLCPDYDLPEPPLEAFYCTASQARARNLPGGLDNLGRALGLDIQKDNKGKALIKKHSIPDAKTGEFNDDPESLQEFYDYCKTDVIVERACESATLPLTDEEFEDYLISERVNDRGIMVDVEFAKAACAYADEETKELNAIINRLTNGQVRTARSFAAIKKWMEPYWQADDRIRRVMTRHKTDKKTGETEVKMTLDKAARFNLGALDNLPPVVVEVVEALDEAGRTSVSKYRSMVDRADPEDDRVRGAYMFAGAGQTGRYSSMGLQVHNFVRQTAKDPDAIADKVLSGEPLDDVLDTLSSMLRPSLIARPGHVFVGGDWSSIEARVLPWLSLEDSAEDILDIFREGGDVYKVEANKIYSVPVDEVDDNQRQTGKVAVLSLGFQGGKNALQAMARNYKIHISDAEAGEIVKAWRAGNPWATAFWKKCEKAATRAVRNPDVPMEAGRLTYICRTEGVWPVLYCYLPCGQTISYPDIRREVQDGPYGPKSVLSCLKSSYKPAAGDPDWPRMDLYGGILVQGPTQGTAARVLRGALRDLDDYDWPVSGHTHDEIFMEVLEDEADEAWATLEYFMKRGRSWTEGLPLDADLWTGGRYGK